jgi:hypothetical protein
MRKNNPNYTNLFGRNLASMKKPKIIRKSIFPTMTSWTEAPTPIKTPDLDYDDKDPFDRKMEDLNNNQISLSEGKRTYDGKQARNALE